MTVPRLTYLTLAVRDMERARAFCEQLLARTARVDGSGLCLFELEGLRLVLHPRDALAKELGLASPGAGDGSVVLSLNVDTRTAVTERLELAERAGACVVQPARERPWGGVVGVLRDPDGHVWEVCWKPARSNR